MTFEGYSRRPEEVGSIAANQVLYVKADNRPPLAEPAQYYHHQLISLDAS